MSEFKGTPGPWVASKSDRSIGPVIRDDDQSYGMILPVAWVEFDGKPGHHQSNANLIAAAPDLLNCLTMGQTMQTPEFLDWIADRLVYVHGEHANCDFITSLRKRAIEMKNARNKALGADK